LFFNLQQLYNYFFFRCSTVVADVIAELCALLGIDSELEQQEFSLYCIVQGDGKFDEKLL
jgi:hypothetical protein